MAFSWILGKRRDLLKDEAKDSILATSQGDHPDRDRTINVADVRLGVEGGLLVATGPLGDPLTPDLLKEVCAAQPETKLTLSNGTSVDQSKVIAVLEAQRRVPLAERPENSWIEAMLGGGGHFESVSADDLARENEAGQPVLSSKLIVGISGGETITIRDAHPGTASRGSRAKLSIDGRSTSIESLLEDSDQPDLDNHNAATLEPTLHCQNDKVILSIGDQVEVYLEEASDIWDAEAKVDVFLGHDQQLSMNDLSSLLKEQQLQDSDQKTETPGVSYPLLDDSEPEFDLSNATIVMVSDVPEGWWLTHGLQSEQGAWMLDPSELTEASLRLPSGSQGTASVQVQVISIVGHAGALERQTRTIAIPPTSKETETMSNSGEHDRAPSVAQLAFNQEELDLAAEADAVLLRGLPDTASLSAGTYDPSVKGWVLRPAQLDQLAIDGLDDHQGSIEIILKAIYFDQNNPMRTRVIAKQVIAAEATSSSTEQPTDIQRDPAA